VGPARVIEEVNSTCKLFLLFKQGYLRLDTIKLKCLPVLGILLVEKGFVILIV
jgi:hypothetical protein